jgi:hypothetical protein
MCLEFIFLEIRRQIDGGAPATQTDSLARAHVGATQSETLITKSTF